MSNSIRMKVIADLEKITDVSIRCDKAIEIMKYMAIGDVTADVANSVVSTLPKYKERIYE